MKNLFFTLVVISQVTAFAGRHSEKIPQANELETKQQEKVCTVENEKRWAHCNEKREETAKSEPNTNSSSDSDSTIEEKGSSNYQTQNPDGLEDK